MMKREQYAHRWVTSMLASIDEHINQETKVRLMESCGRACARSGARESAEECAGDLDRFLSTLKGWIGEDGVRQDKGCIRITYGQCYCSLQAEIAPELARTYCACSCGWLKEMFETVTSKTVEVELESSIKCGSEACRFVVRLEPA